MTTLYHDPFWPRAGEWLRGEQPGGPLAFMEVIGAPAHLGSISPGRADLAPDAIRNALDRYSTYDVDHDLNLLDIKIRDLGNLDIANLRPEDARPIIRGAVASSFPRTDATILLGGDNSITLPGVEALDDCSVVTLDAHFDLRHLQNGLNNGNPIRALLERGMPGHRITQIGIQPFANSEAYADVAARAGIRVITADQARERGVANTVREALDAMVTKYVYVNLDLDVLDRMFAPATPGSRPGGWSPWELRAAAHVCGENPRVRVLDIVEMDPEQDIAGQTALSAAQCLLAFASGVHQRCSRLSDARNL